MSSRYGREAHSWSPPELFDEYRILSFLSQGGMGAVYQAHDTLLDRPVAIKFLRGIKPNAGKREQLLLEARAAARLQHPNVVSVYRVGEIEGRPYIVSELVNGQALNSLPLPVPGPRALELGCGLARGLAAAHRCGVLHRDIKPANAIISDHGEVKLLDFGLAKLVDMDAARGAFRQASLGMRATAPRTLTHCETAGESRSLPGASPALEAGEVAPSAQSSARSGSRSAAPAAHDETHEKGVEPGAARSFDPEYDPIYSQSTLSGELELPDSARSGFRTESHIVGTPLYMPPEIWIGEPSTRKSDIYSMGAVLFELCTGFPPHYMPQASLHDLFHAVNTRDVAPLVSLAPDIDPRFAGVVDRCLRRNPDERYASGDELREALEELLRPSGQQLSPPQGNPYRGLLAFEAEHRALFFGRSSEIGTAIERLRTEAFLLISADSGIGKSSLCRAGVLPLVREGALGGDRQWQVLSLVPGRSPLQALSAALAPILNEPEEELAAHLRSEPNGLRTALHRQLGAQSGVVLFIDQLEEMITMAEPSEAAIVGKALGSLTSLIPSVRMLMTARSDFLARIAALPGLGNELARSLYFLHPMSSEKIRQAIVGPAQAKGVLFESESLVDMLVEETAQTDSGLPLLQFALAELWDVRSSDSLTLRSLESIGGVSGALARHADQVILILPPVQRAAARRILMLLVSMEGTRARRTLEELGPNEESRKALEALVRGRMIVARATGDSIVYEVAHEALIKGWGTLRSWLEESAESRAAKQRIETATVEWIRLGRAKEALWGARQLSELSVLEPSDITAKEAAFIQASRQALQRGRMVRNVLIATVPVLLALFYGGLQYRQARERQHRVTEHLRRGQERFSAARQKDAELRALRKEAFTAFDSQMREAGEKLWARTLKLSRETEEAFGLASQALEAALTVDPSREEVRALLADALLAGAAAADRDRHLLRRNDLVQRMALYDTRGERLRRWQAPALLTIETHPAGAQIRLQRYTEDAQGRRQLKQDEDLGRTPQKDVSLQEGSYLLSFTLQERIAVSYPILIRGAERHHIALELPARAALPEGFVYIPRGRFLFGTSAEESVRQGFLSTVPVHEVESEAYLIGRTEVTYAEWLRFLESLSPAERAQHTIHVPKGGIGGGVDLQEVGDGSWRLMLQPVSQAHRARTGEALVYPSRKLRREQDWLRLPVSGIGPADIRAYAAWLDRSGRVPGARLCSEQEWERAARGADDREYPHGTALASDDANFDETYGKDLSSAGPDAVGSYPASVSPFGLQDMAGNVFEWVDSSLLSGEVVARGGGYFMGAIAARSTNRTPLDPSFRDPAVGARVCASYPLRSQRE